MNRKIVITRIDNKIWTTLFENDEVVEIHCVSEQSILGNIYVGRVKNIVNNINAAFVEIANGVECYYSIAENEMPVFTTKIGKKAICIGDEVLVQVSKEAVKTKVPTVTGKIELTGKYAVLTHGDTRIGVSNKIAKEDRERLLGIAKKFENEKYGFIVRTNAKDASDEVLEQELLRLSQEYESLILASKTRACYSCMKVVSKEYLTILRDVYQEGLTDIIVEEKDLYHDIKEFLSNEQAEDLDKLRLYDDKLLPLHKLYGIEKQIENALKHYVWLKSGAYLVIEPTEALTVIDVNTGKCIGKKKDETTYLKINLEAAKEAARQIRLRNLSGIIVVDFINLSNQEYMQQLLECFRMELNKDPIATTLVDVTKLQLVEVTRKKIRKPLHESIGGTR